MRVLRDFLTLALFLGVVAGLVALVGREMLLWTASHTVENSINEMRGIYRSSAQYATLCREKGVPSSVNAISQIRLRFTSSTEYSTEVVCTQFELDPILVRRNTLPWMVVKSPGSTGIIFDDPQSGIRLKAFGREIGIGVRDKMTVSLKASESLGTPPMTSCTGYGFSCCDEVTEAGMGDSYSAAIDCPKSCSAVCRPRPVVLSLTTDPLYDPVSRVVRISSGQAVAFTYQMSIPLQKKFRGVFSFGDGTQEDLTEASGLINHTYSCASSTCRFQAVIQFVTEENISSVNTSLSSMNVEVTQ